MASIELYVFVGVAHFLQVAFKVFEGDDYCAATVVWMEGQRLPFGVAIVVVILQRSIKEEVYVMFLIIDKSEGRNAARLKAQVLHHALGRGKGKLAARGFALGLKRLFQASFKVVNVKVVVAMEANKIVLVALMVAHEDILAVNRAVIFPPALCLLDSLAFGMAVAREWNAVFRQVV